MRVLFVARVLACLVALLVIGCGGSGGGTDAPVARAPKPGVQTSAARAALTDRTSPAAAVRRFWTYVQQGAVPAVLDVYDAKVVSATGLDNFAAALAGQQQAAAGLKLNVLDVQSVARGRLVLVEGLPVVGLKSSYSFFLRRAAGRWKIAYDSFVASALPASINARAQAAAGSESATPAGVKAAEAALSAYRIAGLQEAVKTARRAAASSSTAKKKAASTPSAAATRPPIPTAPAAGATAAPGG